AQQTRSVLGQPPLRQPRQLEEEHVPTAPQLAETVADDGGEYRRVWRVEHDRALAGVRTHRRQVPGDRSAPVVTDDGGTRLAQMGDEGSNIPRKGIQIIRSGALGLVVTPKIRRHDAVPGGGQRRDLKTP